jgi:hypothetical protein
MPSLCILDSSVFGLMPKISAAPSLPLTRQILFCYFGKVKLKVLPLAGMLSAHILPPWPSIIVLAMDNPSPEPF